MTLTRCANFGTCGAAGMGRVGTSMVNNELFKLFASGRNLLQQGKCSSVRPVVDAVVSLMTVPLVQGSLRYAWKVGTSGSGQTPKNAAEGATFSAAVLPLVSYCNTASASVVSGNLKFGLFPTGSTATGTAPNFTAVKAAFEDVYACLGITCAQVGGLLDGAAPYSGAEACTFQSATMAGYVPGSDVTQHAKIDLDQSAMETELGLSPVNYTGALHWYGTGGNSKTSSPFRTMRGFSTGAQAKMYTGCPGCPYKHYSMFYDYYGDYDYADKWVSAALAGTNQTFTSGKHGPNNFEVLGDAARIEAVKKGSAYMNVWMYVIREFEDAIDDCNTCVSNCNEHSTSTVSVHAWDEGVAFYTGSLEGAATGGSGGGKLLYRLAEKRRAS